MVARVTQYQSIIRSLLYLMIGTRLDIAYAVTYLSQFCTNPSAEHYKAAPHICRYLVGMQDYSLVYSNKGNKGLVAYSDSDWAADKIWCRSITGNFFKLASGIIFGIHMPRKPLPSHPQRLSIWQYPIALSKQSR